MHSNYSIGHKLGIRLVASVILLATTFATAAPEYTSADDIYKAAERHVKAYVATQQRPQQRLEYDISQPDKRLKLALCQQPLAADFRDPPSLGRGTLKVFCPDAESWSMFVPVRFALFQEVVTPKHPLGRGYKITINDLEYREVDVSDLRSGFYTDPTAVVGMLIKRQINAGEPVNPRHLEAPMTVLKGDLVVISAQTGNFSVKMRGIAMRDGVLGRQIPVKNLSSDRVIKAQVMAKGQVRVPM